MVLRWRAALPAVLSTAPLVGISLHSDERRTVFEHALEYSSNPFRAAAGATSGIDGFLNIGNFRPIGRFLDFFEHGVLFEASNASGLPPYVMNGIVRVLMIVVLVLTVIRLVERLGSATTGPSADTESSNRRGDLTGIAMATVLVAGGFANGLVTFSFLFIGTTALTLWIAMFVTRDRDLCTRPTSRSELVLVIFVGTLSAATYDMVYLVPPLAMVFLLARAYGTEMAWPEVRRSAAARRLGALWVGFLAVFVPVRIIIAQRCSGRTCYDASDVRLHIDAAQAFIVRLISSGPPTGWFYNSYFLNKRDVGYGINDLLSSLVLLAAVVGLFAIAARAILQEPKAEPSAESPHISNRSLIAIVGFGASVSVMAAALVSLASRIQVEGPAPGGGWRESILSQTGIGIVFVAVIIAVVERLAASTGRGRRIRNIFLALSLGAVMSATLFANQQMNVFDRQDQASAASKEIGLEMVTFVDTPEANERRCVLADRYSLLTAEEFHGGPETIAVINELAIARHGRPFCQHSVN